jgi:FMN phosphatase YigB (HAD superfamily)
MQEKLILTDCDGVLLDWEKHFHRWMKAKGYKRATLDAVYHQEEQYGLSTSKAKKLVDEFMTSAWMIAFPPLADAQQGVARLADAGYRFHAITAIDYDPYVRDLRLQNLEGLFGKVFVDLTCSGVHNSKYEALTQDQFQGRDLPWIEDKAENAVLGADLGMSSYLISHPYNMDCNDERVVRVNSWDALSRKLLDVN